MADNAPFSVSRPPFPNVVNGFNRRVEQHVLTITGANGSATRNTSRSTQGTTVTYVGEGNYSFTFPAGGTGATGWVQICPPEVAGETVTDVRMYALDSDILNFETGAGRFVAADGSATPAVSDIIGSVTLIINVIKAT